MPDGHEHTAGPLDKTWVNTGRCEDALSAALQLKVLTSGFSTVEMSERSPSKPMSDDDGLATDGLRRLCIHNMQLMTRKTIVASLASLGDIAGVDPRTKVTWGSLSLN